jgi:hypothetical protein
VRDVGQQRAGWRSILMTPLSDNQSGDRSVPGPSTRIGLTLPRLHQNDRVVAALGWKTSHADA